MLNQSSTPLNHVINAMCFSLLHVGIKETSIANKTPSVQVSVYHFIYGIPVKSSKNDQNEKNKVTYTHMTTLDLQTNN